MPYRTSSLILSDYNIILTAYVVKRKNKNFCDFFEENYLTKQGKLLNKKAPAEADWGTGYCRHSYTLSIHAAHKT